MSIFRCYLCGQKFILPQELSRHIRDKVCKCDEMKSIESVGDSEQNLNSLSLLELPIITDMSQEGLIEATQSDVSSVNANSSIDGMPVLWACRQCNFR